MTVVVIGAGVVGVTTAYYLAREGADVIVIERQPGAGLETSYANGGQISANHAAPWAGPKTPWKALQWLGRTDAPLLFHLRWDPALFGWLRRFLANCTETAVRRNIERALSLALYSRRQLVVLRAETGLHYDELTRGILHIFRNPADWREALPQVELMNQLGCTRRPVDAAQCVAIEPALAAISTDLIGGVFSPDDESGDAYAFTRGLARIATERGAQFRYGVTVRTLTRAGNRIAAVETDHGKIAADAVIVAAGSYSPMLLRTLGMRLPVYPAKGYSITVPVESGSVAPTVALIDDEFKMVYSRLGDRLRIAGTAEFAGYDASVDERRARFLLAKAIELFPHCGDVARAEFWAGLRPSTPDGVPVIGPTRLPNLFLNTGHGTLGWTMACGSGRLVADLVQGRTPEIPVDGLSPARFA
ncbi:MAG: D-amino acid dehydrogenase [Rhodospirillales bacterium]